MSVIVNGSTNVTQAFLNNSPITKIYVNGTLVFDVPFSGWKELWSGVLILGPTEDDLAMFEENYNNGGYAAYSFRISDSISLTEQPSGISIYGSATTINYMRGYGYEENNYEPFSTPRTTPAPSKVTTLPLAAYEYPRISDGAMYTVSSALTAELNGSTVSLRNDTFYCIQEGFVGNYMIGFGTITVTGIAGYFD